MRDRAGQVHVWAVRIAIGIVLVVVLALIVVGATQLDLSGDGGAGRAGIAASHERA